MFDTAATLMGLFGISESCDKICAYDISGQLISATLPGDRTIQYNYDAAGNRTTVVDSNVTTIYTTNSVNEYTAAGSTVYTYDNDGNLLTATDASGTTTYTYNTRGQLISASGPSGIFGYEYDALGQRIATTANGTITRDLVDPFGLGNVVGQFNISGQALAHYTYGAGLTSRVDGSNTSAFYDFDAMGNTAALTGTGGAVINSYTYLPFGEHLTVSGSSANLFTFGGQLGVSDVGDGLYFMRARYYSPGIGRFTQRDPAGLEGGDVNIYRYVQNNPVTFVDPSGLTVSGVLGKALDYFWDIAHEEVLNVAALDTVPLHVAQSFLKSSVATDALVAKTLDQFKNQVGEAALRDYAQGEVLKAAAERESNPLRN